MKKEPKPIISGKFLSFFITSTHKSSDYGVGQNPIYNRLNVHQNAEKETCRILGKTFHGSSTASASLAHPWIGSLAHPTKIGSLAHPWRSLAHKGWGGIGLLGTGGVGGGVYWDEVGGWLRSCKHVQESLPLKIIFTSGDQGDLHHLICTRMRTSQDNMFTLQQHRKNCYIISQSSGSWHLNIILKMQNHSDLSTSSHQHRVHKTISSSDDIRCNFHPLFTRIMLRHVEAVKRSLFFTLEDCRVRFTLRSCCGRLKMVMYNMSRGSLRLNNILIFRRSSGRLTIISSSQGSLHYQRHHLDIARSLRDLNFTSSSAGSLHLNNILTSPYHPQIEMSCHLHQDLDIATSSGLYEIILKITWSSRRKKDGRTSETIPSVHSYVEPGGYCHQVSTTVIVWVPISMVDFHICR